MANDKIDVIILADTKWVWRKWEIKSVAISYAKNVLVPKWIARIADEKVKKEKAEASAKLEKHKSEYISNIQDMLLDLEVYGMHLIAQSNPNGKLFAKVDKKTIAKELAVKYKVDILSEYISCDKIENLWIYEINFKYENIKKKFNLEIKKQ